MTRSLPLAMKVALITGVPTCAWRITISGLKTGA